MNTVDTTCGEAGQLLRSEQSQIDNCLSPQQNVPDPLLISEQSTMESSAPGQSGESWLGRQQAFAMIAHKCSEHQAQCLKQLKQDRVYDSFGLTWEQFCDSHLGLSRATADRIVQQLDEFGAAYFKLAALARLSPETYRRIATAVQGETIQIDGEPVAIHESNALKIRAYIQSLRAALRAEKQRTEPSLQELRSRLDNLLAETSRHVSITMPTVLQDYLLQISDDAVRKWTKISKDLRRIMNRGKEAA
jgi:hypothetical protein